MSENHHTPIARLEAGKPPPDHYYARNLLTVVRMVLARYHDILEPEERAFGERIATLPVAAQRLYARLIGRQGPLIRADSLTYPEVDDAQDAVSILEQAGLIACCPPAPPDTLCHLVTRTELDRIFASELAHADRSTKAVRIAHVLAQTPPAFLRWRLKHAVPWLALMRLDHLELYRLLFFGDRHQDLTTFVMRDLRVHRYEPVDLCPETRLFPDRSVLNQYLDLVAMQEDVAALGASPNIADVGTVVAGLLDRLGDEFSDRVLERRRSRLLNRLGRNLERAGAYGWALRSYALSTLAPARERRMRILHKLGETAAVEGLRRAVLADPESTLEAEFATRFARPRQPNDVPTTDVEIDEPPDVSIEQYALELLTESGGVGWHLENSVPMAVFGLAYWSWIFAPIKGAFLHPFQVGPVDLYWPDFFAVRAGACDDPLGGSIKDELRRVASAKAGTANRLFSWHRCPHEVIDAIVETIPEHDLRALVEIVRGDLAGRRSGFPDLTVVYGPGRYEFVEVKGPNDQLQVHQRLWIRALCARGLPVRVLRFRLARQA